MKHWALPALALLGLPGCGSVLSGADCNSEDATAVVESVVRKSVQDSIRSILAGGETETSYTSSQIRAVASKIKVSLADVRTSRDDPNSTKKLCNATATISLPASDVENVDSIRRIRSESLTSDWARDYDLERTSEGFKGDLEYSVQPTDDGGKVFAELPSDQEILKFVTQVAALQLQSREIKQASAEQSRMEAEQRALEAAAERDAEVATQEAEAATLNEARVANQLSRQTINALWTSVPKDSWGPVLPLQRAWVARKQAQCRLEAATTSVDPEQKAIAELNCDTRMTQERLAWLRENMPSDTGFGE